ncbi:MAG: Bug family tripartite tricarboxylate transporter substrate binding protein [Xanthobacteraceae bacterium]
MRLDAIRSTLLALLLAGMPIAAHAQQYPSQDIHFICAFPAGSGSDTIVRYVAEKIRPLSGRNIIVENRFGAAGNVAAEYTMRSKPDGYTIFVHAASAMAANMHLFKKPPIDAAKDIQVAGTINRQPFMMVVDAKKPWKTVAEVTEFLKTKGDKATYATSASNGTVMGEIYKQATGTKAVEVVFRVGTESLNDLLSGAIDYGMYDPVFSMSQAREGRVRMLGVSTAQRLAAVPDLPTMTEQGIPMDLMGWFSAMVPAATPRPIVDQINAWFRQVIATEESKAFLNKFGGDPWVASPDEAQARLLKDIKDWGEYVRLAKIEPQG